MNWSGVVRRRKLTLECLEQFMELNGKFHAEILHLSDCRMLQRAMEHVCSLPFASPSAFVRRQYLAPESWELFRIAIDQHQGILDAITNREAARAETLAREHARVARQEFGKCAQERRNRQIRPGDEAGQALVRKRDGAILRAAVSMHPDEDYHWLSIDGAKIAGLC